MNATNLHFLKNRHTGQRVLVGIHTTTAGSRVFMRTERWFCADVQASELVHYEVESVHVGASEAYTQGSCTLPTGPNDANAVMQQLELICRTAVRHIAAVYRPREVSLSVKADAQYPNGAAHKRPRVASKTRRAFAPL